MQLFLLQVLIDLINLDIVNMDNKKSLNFVFVIIALILGWTLFKQFDFENLKFEKTGLAIVYIIGLVISIYFLIRNYKKRPEK